MNPTDVAVVMSHIMDALTKGATILNIEKCPNTQIPLSIKIGLSSPSVKTVPVGEVKGCALTRMRAKRAHEEKQAAAAKEDQEMLCLLNLPIAKLEGRLRTMSTVRNGKDNRCKVTMLELVKYRMMKAHSPEKKAESLRLLSFFGKGANKGNVSAHLTYLRNRFDPKSILLNHYKDLSL